MATPNPHPTLLDQNQILQRTFDEAEDRLRVDIGATITMGGDLEVALNQADDSVAIGDGTNLVKVSSDGALSVTFGGIADDFGTTTSALRTASQIGNATGAADFNSGASTAQTLRVSSNLSDGSGNVITSSISNSNRLIHSQTPDTTSSVTLLNALNASVSIALVGLTSVGFQLNVGTFVGTITALASVDGGINYTPVPFYDPANSAVLPSLIFSGSPNGLKIVSVIPIGGCSHVKVQVTSYTSGAANGLLRAANVTGAAGAITASAFSSVSNTYPSLVTNIASLILPANVNRKYAYIANSTASTIRIQYSTGTGLTGTTGITIPAQTYFELKGGNLFTGDVYAFCSSSISLSVSEGTP